MTPVTGIPAFSLAYLEAVGHIQYHMVAALSVLVWDLLLTLKDEIEYVWRMRRCMDRWFYFYFRYFLLAAQIFHLAILPSLSSGRMSDFQCTMWYEYMMFILELSSCVIEIILAKRVFALYNRSRKVGIFLCILVISEVGVVALNMAECSTMKYLEACIIPRPRKEMANPLGGIIIIVQSIIMGMLIWKHFAGSRLGWGRTPLLSLFVKDATSYYSIVSLMCGIAMAVCALDDLRILGIIYWSISLFSVAGCRLILNMERFVRENVQVSDEDEIMLTSHISL